MLRTVGKAIMLGGLALLGVAAVQLAMGEGFPAGLVFGGLGALLVGALLRDLIKDRGSDTGSSS